MENRVGYGMAFLSCSFCTLRGFVDVWQGPDGTQELDGWDCQEGKLYCPNCAEIIDEFGGPIPPVEDADVRAIRLQVWDFSIFE